MSMLITYNGQIRDGKPVIFEDVVLPENTEFVLVLENVPPILETQTLAQKQYEALQKFSKDIKEIKDEPLTDADFAVLENNRVNFSRDIDNKNESIDAEFLQNLFAEAEKAEDNLTNEEWAEFANLRSQTNLSRKVEKWFTP